MTEERGEEEKGRKIGSKRGRDEEKEGFFLNNPNAVT